MSYQENKADRWLLLSCNAADRQTALLNITSILCALIKDQGQRPPRRFTNRANVAERDSSSYDMGLNIHNANTHTHRDSREASLSLTHPFIVFVCCFYGNAPPHSAAYRWNRLKSVENSRESYFCSLDAQCGSNWQKLLRVLISCHIWTELERPVLQSAVRQQVLQLQHMEHALIKLNS